jgi:hypothetical protein
MASGYLAFLDVLGFSALVGADRTGGRIQKYLDCLERTSNKGSVDFVVFSDSIILTAEGDDAETFLGIAQSCSTLFFDLLKEGVPLRGAIAHGSFVRKAVKRSVFVAGRAVVEAYRFEQAQNWVGIMVAPSALEQNPNLVEKCRLSGFTGDGNYQDLQSRIAWPAFIQRCEHMPFHSESGPDLLEGFAVVPTSGVLERVELRNSIQEAIDKMAWLRSIAPSPGAQFKYRQPMIWLNQILTWWREAAATQARLASLT